MNQINLILQRSIAQANRRISTTLQRLATGMRINSPADDPTGLVLSTNLNTQIRALAQAKQNIQTGINMLGVGSDALKTMESTLQQLKDLTEKAANGTYSGAQRQQMQKQANELLKSLYNTKNSTSFGSVDLFGSTNAPSSTSSSLTTTHTSPVSYASYAATKYAAAPSSVGSATNDGSGYETYAIENTSSAPTSAPLSSSAPTSSGSSSSGDEIHITSAQDFIDKIAADGSGTAGKTYVLDNDIDFSSISNYASKANFAGTLDGNGHSIKNLTSEQNGLFKSTTSESTIKDLTLSNFSILTSGASEVGSLVGQNAGTIKNVAIKDSTVGGYRNIGGLVGNNSGTITNSSVSGGSVEEKVGGGMSPSNIGGLVGSNSGNISLSYSSALVNTSISTNVGGLVGMHGGTITTSYSTGSVNGVSKVGGLVGYNYMGGISYSYSTGSVSGSSKVGGFVGEHFSEMANGYITNSFWNTQTAGVTNAIGSGSSNGITGLTLEQFKTSTPFTNAGWDTSIWTFGIGESPMLNSEKIHITSAQDFIDKIAADGSNTAGKVFVLDNDIDFSSISNYVSKTDFAGTLDGNGHTIKNLAGANGLFASTNGATIKNLNLENINITASSQQVGGLIGSAENTQVTNVSVSGTISNSGASSGSGSMATGGLIGYATSFVKIDNTSSSVSVDANYSTLSNSFYSTGGLVGQAGYNIDISNSSATGNVSASSAGVNPYNSTVFYSGGLVGYSAGSGSILNSFAKGDVTVSNNSTASAYMGGLVGYNYHYTISDTYATGDVTFSTSKYYGDTYIGGHTGYNDGSLTKSYATGKVVGIPSATKGGLVGYNSQSVDLITYSFYNSTDNADLLAVGGGNSNFTTGTGLTLEQFKTSTPFTNAGWDNSIWTFGIGDSPMLGNEIHITSAQDFIDKIAADGSNTAGKTFILDNDIDFSSISGFKGIEDFAGTFDGNGHVIKNLTIDRSSEIVSSANTGLFASTTSSAVIKNVGLENATVKGANTGSGHTGALVGTLTGQVINSYVTGTVSGNYFVGGLVGKNAGGAVSESHSSADVTALGSHVGGLVGGMSSGNITDSYATGNVTSQGSNVGGLVGDKFGNISNSHASGNVTGYSHVGGLVGNNGSGLIENSYASGDVTGTGGRYVGGLAGYLKGTVKTSYASGNVTGSSTSNNVGGLAGLLDNSSVIENSYAMGDVIGNQYVGGLIGTNYGTVTNSYSYGQASANSAVGGFIGYNNTSGTTSGSFYNSSINGTAVGNTTMSGLSGISAQEFSNANNFITKGWDTSIWAFGIGNAPLLSNQVVHITSAQDFIDKIAADGSNTAGKVFVLDNDIDFSSISSYVQKTNFAGTLIGNGHTISNLSADRGLFDTILADAEIKDLKIDGFTLNAIRGSGGTLAGSNAGKITNVTVTNSHLNAAYGVSGLVGSNSGHILNSSVSSTVITSVGGGAVGGLAHSNTGIIESSSFSGEITVGQQSGGLVGTNSGSIINSYSEGTLNATGDSIGGLTGINSAGGTITGSYSTMYVSGNEQVGGVAGINEGTISTTYSSGGVNGSVRVGGLVGHNNGGIITGSHASGNVSGTSEVGGLIGASSGGTISGSHYENGTVTATGNNAGGLIGYNQGGVTNSYSSGELRTTGNNAGGLIGLNESGSSLISNSHSSVNVYATGAASTSVGGFVGENRGNITNSYATGSISGINKVGGFAGYHGSGTIQKSYATGTVNGNKHVGGFVGFGDSTTNIFESYSTGNVSGKTNVGGFAGYLISVTKNSYSTGNVRGIAGGSGNVGGFAGQINSTYSFQNIYSFGKVDSILNNTGGFAGLLANNPKIENSFWNTQTAGVTNAIGSGTSTGVTGLTNDGFANNQNFINAGWSNTIWNLDKDNPRPHLAWENYVAPPKPGVDPGGDPGDPDFDGYPDPPDGGSTGGGGSYPIDPGNSSGKTEVTLQIGADSSESSRITLDTSLDLDSIWINLSNSDYAARSLDSINKALSSITNKIASFSTYADILESMIDSNEVMSENLSAAKSTIMDADIAAETLELMKSQKQLEMSQTMLTQVNNMKYESAIKLIQGLDFSKNRNTKESSSSNQQNILNQIQNSNAQHQKTLTSIQEGGDSLQQALNKIQDNNIYHQNILDTIQQNNAKNAANVLKIINRYKQI